MKEKKSTLYMVDLLENKIVYAIYDYIIKDNFSAYPNYFDEWIPNQLYEDFELNTLELLRTLPLFFRATFLEESLSQFTFNTPPNRVDVIYDKYWKIFNPDKPDWEMDLSQKKKLNPALRAYNKHFYKFRILSIELYNANKTGTLNLVAHIFGETEYPDNEILKSNVESPINPGDIVLSFEKPDEIPVNKTDKPINPNDIILSFETPDEKPVNQIDTPPILDVLFEAVRNKTQNQIEREQANETHQKSIQNFKEYYKPVDDNFEIDQYLNDWLDSSVTLSQWLSHKNIDVIEELKYMSLSPESVSNIRGHQYNLYNLCVSNLASANIQRFEGIQSLSNKIEIANRDLALINDLINGNLDLIKIDRLNTLFFSHEWHKMVVQFELIIRGRFESENNHDIHHPDSFLHAAAIYKYYNYLKYFLDNLKNETPIKTPYEPPIQKQSTIAYKHKKYSSHLTRLNTLLKFFQNNTFISPSIDIKDFRKIFNNTLPDSPIIWIGSIEELSYFIKSIHKEHEIIEKIPRDIWKVTATLFVDEFNSSFCWQKFRGQKRPARFGLIDKAVEILL